MVTAAFISGFVCGALALLLYGAYLDKSSGGL